MKKIISLLVLCYFIVACSQTDTQSSEANIQTVKNFIKAFNERKLDNMLAIASDDVEWLSVDGNEISIVTGNKKELAATLESYFKDCTSCRSSVENILANNSRVSVTEVSSWETDNGINSQSSLSVYEIDKGLIKRVYYFPEEVVESK